MTLADSPPAEGPEYYRPWMYPKQKAAFFNDSRISICEASTKSGKTAGCIIWLFEQAAAGKEGQNFWWVAPILGVARIAFDRMKRAVPRALYTTNETESRITLANGARIWFKGADNPDTLYGEDVYGAVMDEASRCKEAAYHALYSTLTATGGPLRLIGNVKGRKNFAYKLARRAEAGEPGMEYHRITAQDAIEAGVIKADVVEAARRDLPESVFRELYGAEASDDEGNPFGLDAIRSRIGPMSLNPPVAWGWDLAKSMDWTVGIGLDAQFRVCRLLRFQKPWPETTDAIQQVTGSVPALVDSTGVGDPILDTLQRTGGNYEGFKFTAPSKQQLMEGLAVAIQQGPLMYPEGVIPLELEAFEYVYTRTGVRYSAPEGMHDDAVCALALAVRCATMPGEREEYAEYDDWQPIGPSY